MKNGVFADLRGIFRDNLRGCFAVFGGRGEKVDRNQGSGDSEQGAVERHYYMCYLFHLTRFGFRGGRHPAPAHVTPAPRVS